MQSIRRFHFKLPLPVSILLAPVLLFVAGLLAIVLPLVAVAWRISMWPAPARLMALIAALVVVACVSGCASATPPPAGPDTSACIPPEVQAQCRQEGGCALFTRKRLEQLAQEVGQQGFEQGAQACRRQS